MPAPDLAPRTTRHPPTRASRWIHRLVWAWLALCGLGLVAAELRTPGAETCRTR